MSTLRQKQGREDLNTSGRKYILPGRTGKHSSTIQLNAAKFRELGSAKL